MGFSDVLGHETQLARLKAAITSDRIHHAYLFSGLAGVGKRTVADVFSRALNCERRDGDACDTCESCRRTLAGTHPDVRTFAGDATNAVIKVEVVRADIMRFVGLKRSRGPYRVIIIPNVERMPAPTANTFLKTLEEPPEGTVFILTTNNAGLLLPTIRSRCQKIQLSPLPETLIAGYLSDRKGLAPERARLIARVSGGSLGKALSLEDDEVSARATFLNTLVEALTGQGGFVELTRKISKGKPSRKQVTIQLETLSTFLRDVAIRNEAPSVPLMNPDYREAIETFVSRTTFEDILRLDRLTKELRIAMTLNVSLEVIQERLLIGVQQLGKARHAQ